jgi:hypothetical protein
MPKGAAAGWRSASVYWLGIGGSSLIVTSLTLSVTPGNGIHPAARANAAIDRIVPSGWLTLVQIPAAAAALDVAVAR